jgi:tRNA threonylcarbamoyladenosine biosynthesis protein TsaB
VSYFLNIETATTVCSVSISKNEELLFLRELNEGFTHAENLHLFIQEALRETGINPDQLSAIAVSKGPGSYTGLRIGVSSAKGLAYALNIPLISINTLQLIALAAFSLKNEAAFYCPMIDARRMEVYTSLFDSELSEKTRTEALIIDEKSIEKYSLYPKIYYFGDGMPKCKALLSTQKNASFIEDLVPSAKNMPKLVTKKFISKDFEDLVHFEPLYLKDFLIKKKKTAV